MEGDLNHKNTMIDGFRAELVMLKSKLKSEEAAKKELVEIKNEHFDTKRKYESLMELKKQLKDELVTQSKRLNELESNKQEKQELAKEAEAI